MIREFFQTIHYPYFFLSALLFIAGIYLAPIVVDKNLTWLLKYPRWMRKMIERPLNKPRAFITLFLTIFTLNNLSLFASFSSGFLVIFPLLAAFFTGLNIAIISYDMMRWEGIWHMLVNPVAWIEFPASWISFSFGFQLAEAQIRYQNFPRTYEMFLTLIPAYFKYVFTLLLLAGLLESALIVWAEKQKDKLD